MRPRPLALLCLSLLLVPGLATAQAWGGSTTVEALSDGATIDGAQLAPGQPIHLVANVTPPDDNDTAYRAFLNGTLAGQPIDGITSQSNGEPMTLPIQLSAPNRTGNATLTWTLTVQQKDLTAGGNQTGNGTGNQTQGNATAGWRTVEEFPQSEELTFTVAPIAPGPQPGLPWAWILAGGAGVVVGGSAAYWWRTRDRQIRGEARSKAMRDLEGESFEEEPEEPEVHPQLKILQARAEDVERMIELAKERHESGDLTEHQYKTIRERKEAELEEIHEEMDEYR